MFATPLILAIIIFGGIFLLVNRGGDKGALQVTSVPQSNVYLDGKLIGKTPLCIGGENCKISSFLPAGNYTLKLVPFEEGDLIPYEEKIPINKSTLTVVDRTFLEGAGQKGSVISLSPLDDKKDLQLLIISFPDKANVFLDKTKVGETPLLLEDVTESDHDLLMTKEGYTDKLVKIRPREGYKLTALVYLGVDLSLASPSAEESAQVPEAASIKVQKVVILDTPTGFLRVRSASSTASLEITRVSPGETFELISEGSGWFEIKLKDGKTGWVSSQYAKRE